MPVAALTCLFSVWFFVRNPVSDPPILYFLHWFGAIFLTFPRSICHLAFSLCNNWTSNCCSFSRIRCFRVSFFDGFVQKTGTSASKGLRRCPYFCYISVWLHRMCWFLSFCLAFGQTSADPYPEQWCHPISATKACSRLSMAMAIWEPGVSCWAWAGVETWFATSWRSAFLKAVAI